MNACDDQDYEVFRTLDGQPRASTWQPIKVRRVPADEHQASNPSDFPWLGAHALVMRTRAIDTLRRILEAHGEILPLATDDDVQLFLFNPRAVDALDEAQSSIVRFPGSDRIMLIKQVAFVEPRIRGLDIFRLPHRGSSTYASDRFVNLVAQTGLTGLDFIKVWSSA